MKKTITMLLLTALCMTVFASCDLGNGLVAELLGDIKDAGADVDYYPTDDYIAIATDIVIDVDPIEPPVVEIETTPSYEIITEEYTGPYTTWEDWTYDVTVDIDIAYPDVQVDFDIRTVECNHPEGTEYMESVSGSVLGAELSVKNTILSISFVGTAVLYAGECTVGYRIENACVLDDGFWGVGTDSEPEYRELRIEIPADLLLDGYNEVTLIYEMDREIYEIGTIVVFKELPTTAGEDTVEISVEETVEEATTEIEVPEIDIDN